MMSDKNTKLTVQESINRMIHMIYTRPPPIRLPNRDTPLIEVLVDSMLIPSTSNKIKKSVSFSDFNIIHEIENRYSMAEKSEDSVVG